MKVVNFVSYFDSGSLWAVRAGNPARFDPADYCGRKIAIQSGSWHEKIVNQENDACKSAGKPEITILPFSAQTEALTRVAAGGADATVSGSSTMGYAVKRRGLDGNDQSRLPARGREWARSQGHDRRRPLPAIPHGKALRLA